MELVQNTRNSPQCTGPFKLIRLLIPFFLSSGCFKPFPETENWTSVFLPFFIFCSTSALPGVRDLLSEFWLPMVLGLSMGGSETGCLPYGGDPDWLLLRLNLEQQQDITHHHRVSSYFWLLILEELFGLEFLSRLLFCFFISLFLFSSLSLCSRLVSVLKEWDLFGLQVIQTITVSINSVSAFFFWIISLCPDK